MKAVQFSEYGGPEVLRVSDVEEPHAGAGQIRVAVRGAGVNPVDWKVRSGAMQQFMPIDLPEHSRAATSPGWSTRSATA